MVITLAADVLLLQVLLLDGFVRDFFLCNGSVCFAQKVIHMVNLTF